MERNCARWMEKQAEMMSRLMSAGMDGILGVGELTEQLRKNLENRFPFVWVRGEVSNLSKAASGHIYFSLKDAAAQLQCVWFAGKQKHAGAGQKFDPLTGEIFETPKPAPQEYLRNGQELLCAGSISVYAGRGQYQLIAEFIEKSGHGALARAFEERRAKLERAGFFMPERKRPLPGNPARIALVTSPHGAAIHDFLELASNRGISSTIRLFPVPVQGAEAAEKIAQALKLANSQNWAEVIVLIRGGGSLEDLWAFNEEILAEAIFRSRLPVLAGIGHEVDVSLADLTADVRAATPSHAAQLLWPLRRELCQNVDELTMRMASLLDNRIIELEKSLNHAARILNWLSPAQKLDRLKKRLEELDDSLSRKSSRMLSTKMEAWRRLDYAVSTAANLWRRLSFFDEKLQWLEKSAPFVMKAMLSGKESLAGGLERRLHQAAAKFLESRLAALAGMEARLKVRDPLAPLQRGYALLRTDEKIVQSVDACQPGQLLLANLADGTLKLRVEAISKGGINGQEF